VCPSSVISSINDQVCCSLSVDNSASSYQPYSGRWHQEVLLQFASSQHTACIASKWHIAVRTCSQAVFHHITMPTAALLTVHPTNPFVPASLVHPF